uniref:hypothetical protein n=1 Tax=Herbidospora sakaeratensis TaxID=564415 RepID=UPI000B21D95F|nr:hypothetical protein [Herbidospora sakaeratensis]
MTTYPDHGIAAGPPPQTGHLLGVELPVPLDAQLVAWIEFGLWALKWVAIGAAAAYVLRRLVLFVRPRTLEDVLTIVAAGVATGVSAQGMWQFAGDVLGFDGPLRLLLFAFIEVAVITSAVRARRNMRENYAAGIDGLAVWVLTGLSAVLSAMDAASVAEAIFRLAAPLVAAWLWERGMAIERVKLTGRHRIHWRLTPERAMVRLGLAESSDRTASDVDAHRRLTRVALAAKRARHLRETGASQRRQRAALDRVDRAMDKAVEHTGLASDETIQRRLVDYAAAMDAQTFVELTPVGPWKRLNHPALRGPVDHEVVAAADARGAEAVADFEAWRTRTGRGLVATTLPVATIHATGRDGAEAPVDAFGSRLARAVWPVSGSRFVTLDGRPVARPVRELIAGRGSVAVNGSVAVAEVVADEERSRPDDDRSRDQKQPTEQDRRRVARYWAKRVKAGEVLSNRALADRSGFKKTWCLDRIREGRELLADERWTFAEDGTPIPPVAELVAATTGRDS